MSKSALIIIDFQNDYFPGGKWLLTGIEQAAKNAANALAAARSKGDLVVHIRHEFAQSDAPFLAPGTEGAKVHPALAEQQGEVVLVKQQINAFQGTGLHSLLQENNVDSLVILGNMTNVCVDAAVRAAADLGYKVTVLHDACATHDQSFNDVIVPAAQVQAAFMAALSFGYASVVSTVSYLEATT